MMEYTIHFQKGTRVGARSLRMEHVEATSAKEAIAKGKALFPTFKADGYKLTRVDVWDEESGRYMPV